MRILISGSSGFIGTALLARLRAGGHEIVRLVRGPAAAGPGDARWDPEGGHIETQRLEGLGAAVHLAGESIASGRWTAARKRRIRDSRVLGTGLLSSALASLAAPPAALVCASAVGYYGDRGDEVLTEASGPGSDFLARVCIDWEAAAEPARTRGIRVVQLRNGLVLGAGGGLLKQLGRIFQLGLGGRLGSGRQYMSWIELSDLLRVIEHAIGSADLAGAVNAVSPHPVTNAEFTAALANALARPALAPAPALGLRLVLGRERADAVLASQRAVPKRLVDAGFEFGAPKLETALARALGGPPQAMSRA